jgi:hypothetical protein
MVTKNKAVDKLKKLETNASEPDQMMNIAHLKLIFLNCNKFVLI